MNALNNMSPGELRRLALEVTSGERIQLAALLTATELEAVNNGTRTLERVTLDELLVVIREAVREIQAKQART